MSSLPAAQPVPIARIILTFERDVVVARQQLRRIAELAGFDHLGQIRIVTSVSELARNVIQYAGGGRIDVDAELQPGQTAVVITVRDEGPGIPQIEAILDGRYQSPTGMGKGILGTRRLMDGFSIATGATGTSISILKKLPKRAPDLTRQQVDAIRLELAKQVPDDPFYELQRQNQELLRTLDELRARQDELAQLNEELEATNRGVVALYAELDERANYLRKVSDLKTRFLSNMGHEFRTPLNSIRTLSDMLLERLDGPLHPEQDKQVRFIRHASEELSALVDDLLDLAKVEAGRLTVRLDEFDIASLFHILRGMLKPLTNETSVDLVFEAPSEGVALFSDEGKVSQILRNFVSNALKFTTRGEVRVTATPLPDDSVVFTVKDTGIGIGAEHLDLIFEEFSQVESTVQNSVKGTGLGLPLSRRLAELLGGKVWVESVSGKGSCFYLSLPRNRERRAVEGVLNLDADKSATRRVLIIDDDHVCRYVLQSLFSRMACHVVQAASGEEGLRLVESMPDVIFLDLSMPGIPGDEVLDRLKASERYRNIPVIVNTSMALGPAEVEDLKGRGAAAVLAKGGNFVDSVTRMLENTLQWKTEV